MKRKPYQFILWRVCYEKLHSSFAEGLLISKTFDWRGIQQWQRRNSLSEKRENPVLQRKKIQFGEKAQLFWAFCALVDEATREVEVGMMGGSVRGRNCSHSTSGKLPPTFFLLSHLNFEMYLYAFWFEMLFSLGPYCSQRLVLHLNLFSEHEYFQIHRSLIKHWTWIPPTQIKKTKEKVVTKTKLSLSLKNLGFHFHSAVNQQCMISDHSSWWSK